jgi:transposase
MTTALRKSYPSDISDEEWVLAAPYLTLMREDAGQRDHSLRDLLDGLRYVVRTGIPWRSMPHDLPRWDAVYGQATRWMRAGCFDALAQDLRAVLRMASERAPDPTAAVLDSRTLRSTPESGARAGYDGAKRKKGSKVHLAVDTLGHLLALHVTAADASDRAAVERLVQDVQDVTEESVEIAYVDQGYTGEQPAAAAAGHGVRLEVVKLPEAKRGFVLLPRRWVVERSFGWATRCRRLVRDYECLAQTLADMHTIAFSMLMLKQAGNLAQIHNTL